VSKPATIERTKDNITFFPKSGCPNLQAIDPLTRLFDITARRIVLAATEKLRSPRHESTAMVWVIASTSANPDTIPSAE
jgi:hypothetical protein